MNLYASANRTEICPSEQHWQFNSSFCIPHSPFFHPSLPPDPLTPRRPPARGRYPVRRARKQIPCSLAVLAVKFSPYIHDHRNIRSSHLPEHRITPRSRALPLPDLERHPGWHRGRHRHPPPAHRAGRGCRAADILAYDGRQSDLEPQHGGRRAVDPLRACGTVVWRAARGTRLFTIQKLREFHRSQRVFTRCNPSFAKTANIQSMRVAKCAIHAVIRLKERVFVP